MLFSSLEVAGPTSFAASAVRVCRRTVGFQVFGKAVSRIQACFPQVIQKLVICPSQVPAHTSVTCLAGLVDQTVSSSCCIELLFQLALTDERGKA